MGGPAKCMFEVWRKATMDRHSITDVVLSPKDEEQLSETVKQYAEVSFPLLFHYFFVFFQSLMRLKFLFPSHKKSNR